MDYLSVYQKNLKYLISQIPNLVSDEILEHEDEILDMNRNQIRRHIGNDGSILNNTSLTPFGNPYTGFYTPLTNLLSGGRKMTGAPYDFEGTGSFFREFQLSSTLSIYSTGIGSGTKKNFFDGYNNLFGLTNENETRLLEEVKSAVARYMINKLWE